MKRKPPAPKIKPFKGSTMVTNGSYDQSDLLEFISSMGYLIYENPFDENALIISDKILTYGDLKKNSLRFGIALNSWADWNTDEIGFKEELTETIF